MSSLMNSIPPINLETICGIQLLSDLCSGGSFSHPSFNMGNYLLNNESSISELAKVLNFSKNSKGDFNLSELKELLGPFVMLSSPPPSNSPSSSFFPSNESDTSFLNQLFFNESNNGTASSNTTNFYPFGSLFSGSSSSNSSGEGNDTSLGFFNNGSLRNDSSSSFTVPYLKSNETVDILRMLELLQGGGS
jgi:hypothetical protein